MSPVPRADKFCADRCGRRLAWIAVALSVGLSGCATTRLAHVDILAHTKPWTPPTSTASCPERIVPQPWTAASIHHSLSDLDDEDSRRSSALLPDSVRLALVLETDMCKARGASDSLVVYLLVHWEKLDSAKIPFANPRIWEQSWGTTRQSAPQGNLELDSLGSLSRWQWQESMEKLAGIADIDRSVVSSHRKYQWLQEYAWIDQGRRILHLYPSFYGDYDEREFAIVVDLDSLHIRSKAQR